MLSVGRSELICDLAETYHIYDYRRVPARLLGTLAVGLGDNSRIMRKMHGVTESTEVIMMARILDALNLLIWSFSKDGEKGRNRPKSVADLCFAERKQKQTAGMSIEEFERMRAEILRGGDSNADTGNSVCADSPVSEGD